MANIIDKIQAIRQAVYGRDVRGSIADGIEAINTEVESTTEKQNLLETEFDQLIINAGSSNAEIVQARVDSEGTAYPSLKERLDTIETRSSDTEINILSFGGKGDWNGTTGTDNTVPIRDAIAATPIHGTLIIPAGGKYKVTDTIMVDKNINFICDGEIIYAGTRDKAAFHFNRQVGMKIEFNHRFSEQSAIWHGWTNESFVGIVFENLYKCKVVINHVENFTVGVRCLVSGGINYGFFFNTLNINQLVNNKIQFELYQKDVQSWFNSNIINDMFFTYTQIGDEFQTANVDRYCIKQTLVNGNEYPSDSNIFYNTRFDIGNTLGGTYTGIHILRAWGWKFENYRVELVAGSNVKFANLDLAFNDIKGMVFNPAFETYTAPVNVAINLLNATQGTKSYNEIYTKKGVYANNDFTLLFEDKNWNERYRKPSNDYRFIDRLYRYILDRTTLTATSETDAEYSPGSDALIENGVAIPVYYSGVLYLKNFSVGDSVTVELAPAVVPGTLNISLKPFDISDTLIDNNVISGISAISAGNAYWDTTNKRLTLSNENNTITFTINHSNLKTVAILFSGGLNGIKIYSTNNRMVVKRSVIANRNNFPHHVLDASPTLTTAGKFLPDEIYYNSNTAAGQPISWKLKDGVWTNTGTY